MSFLVFLGRISILPSLFIILLTKFDFLFIYCDISVCYGDAGGPAAVFDGQTKKATLVGLAGWGRPCAQKAYPDVYSRVSAIRDWIRRQTRI